MRSPIRGRRLDPAKLANRRSARRESEMGYLLKRRWLLAAAVLASVSAMLVAGSVATAGKKPKTKVELEIFKEKTDDGDVKVFVYEVTITKPKKCKKNRRVVIVWDQNGNGKKDKGEVVIGRGRTNGKGHFDLETVFKPPRGDRVLVIVKKNRKCKRGKTSERA